MKLQVKFKTPGLADCEISIRAKGFLLAMVYWSVETRPLPGWSSMAAIPIDGAGKGFFRLEGGRGIPAEATHLYARCITPDFEVTESAAVRIPDSHRVPERKSPPLWRATLMSDLHLSGKAGKAVRALTSADSDTLLLAGDLTNDGYTEQFALLRSCIEEKAPDKRIFSVTGNHDQLFERKPEIMKDYEGYEAFQNYLLRRGEKQGIKADMDASGAYGARVNGVDIIGLQCVDSSRKFVFPEGAQLRWLERRLDGDAGWHIILCHAPLLGHNPHRNTGAPYLSRNDELQRIIDSHEKIIFVSGHTHISPNGAKSCVEYNYEKKIVYINDGSVTPTELTGESLMPAEWKDGVRMELALWEDELEIKTKSVHRGLCYPRGYYRYKL